MEDKTWTRHRYIAFAIFLFFALVHLCIPLINHYNFKTFAFDYGVYNFAFYDFAHFRISYCPVYLVPYPITFLQDHVSFTLILLSPLYWILTPLFGTYSLLILQWALIISGGWASYRFVALKTGRPFMAVAAMLFYFTLYARFASYQSDCNLATMGAAIVPAFLYFFLADKKIPLLLSFIFLLSNREDFSLGLFFLCIMLAITYRRDAVKKRLALILAAISLLCFILVFRYVIPLFENEHWKFSLFNYSALGKGPMEALVFVCSHPLKTLEMLFVNHTGNPAGDGIKAEFYITWLVSGGFLLFYRPVYLIPLIPLIAKKMFNDNFLRWGIELYQGVEIASLMPVLVFSVLAELNIYKLQQLLATVVCGLTLFISFRCLKASTKKAYGFNKVDFLSSSFYNSDYDVRETRRLLRMIPDTAAVCASGRLLPHLALREHIYHFSYVDRSNYVFVYKTGHTFPLSQEEFTRYLDEMMLSGNWEILDESQNLLLLKRK